MIRKSARAVMQMKHNVIPASLSCNSSRNSSSVASPSSKPMQLDPLSNHIMNKNIKLLNESLRSSKARFSSQFKVESISDDDDFTLFQSPLSKIFAEFQADIRVISLSVDRLIQKAATIDFEIEQYEQKSQLQFEEIKQILFAAEEFVDLVAQFRSECFRKRLE